jgi:hypothetical protein
MLRSIRHVDYRALAKAEDLVAYVRRVEEAIEPGIDGRDEVVARKLHELLIDVMAKSVKDRETIRADKLLARSRAGYLLLMSILVTFGLVGTIILASIEVRSGPEKANGPGASGERPPPAEALVGGAAGAGGEAGRESAPAVPGRPHGLELPGDGGGGGAAPPAPGPEPLRPPER